MQASIVKARDLQPGDLILQCGGWIALEVTYVVQCDYRVSIFLKGYGLPLIVYWDCKFGVERAESDENKDG